MRISETNKIAAEHGPTSEGPGEFWKVIAPHLLEPSSLGIIQALIREGRPLTPSELASHLELELEVVRERLMQWRSRGS